MSFPAIAVYGCRYIYGASFVCTGSEQNLFDCHGNFYGDSHTGTTTSYGVRCGGMLIVAVKVL